MKKSNKVADVQAMETSEVVVPAYTLMDAREWPASKGLAIAGDTSDTKILKMAVAAEKEAKGEGILLGGIFTFLFETRDSLKVDKPPKVSKRPYLDRVKTLLEAGTHTRKELIDLVQKEFPEVKLSAIQTFFTDLRNAKYSQYKPRNPVSKKFVFADKALIQAELPVEEVLEVVTVEQGEGYTQDPEAEQAGE
ncbi:MAG: hypothetical protein ABSF90_22590 [Syntrophobacteraceae bacterium]